MNVHESNAVPPHTCTEDPRMGQHTVVSTGRRCITDTRLRSRLTELFNTIYDERDLLLNGSICRIQ